MPRTAGIAFGLAAVVCAGAAIAGEPPKANEDKPVCKSERSLSSRVVKRVCKSASELRADSEAARNKLKLGAKSQTTEAFKSPTGQ